MKNKIINYINKFEYTFFLDIIVCLNIILLSLKRGGFYNEDIIIYVIISSIIGLAYIIYDLLNGDIKKVPKYLYFVIALAIAYILPIIFNKYVHFEDALYEFFKYMSLFFTCYIVYKSKNKYMYILTIVLVAIFQCVLGLDSMGNRVFQGFVNSLGSSYLSKTRDRLSGTIQYANATGSILLISLIFVFKYFNENLIKNDKIKICITSCLILLFTVCTLLTKSRMIIFLFILSLCIYFLFKKYNLKSLVIMIINLILSFLAYENINDIVLNLEGSIYITMICYIILSYLLTSYILKLNFLNKEIKLNKIIIISVIVISVILLGISSNLYSSLVITSNDKNISITRNLYNISDNGKNILSFDIEDKDADYIINIYSEDLDYNIELIKVVKKEEIDKDIILDVDKKFNKFIIVFGVSSGSIEVIDCKLNGESEVLNYLVLPSDLMFRFKEILKGSSSTNDRIEYFKDGIKIWSKSIIIGNGGEAFRHMYKEVQTYNYKSTEVHNSFVQILLESGILGFVSIVIVIILNFKNNKDMYLKLILSIFILYSFFDLSFTFHLNLIIFGILIAIIDCNE